MIILLKVFNVFPEKKIMKIILSILFLSLMFGQINAQTEAIAISQNFSPNNSVDDFLPVKNLAENLDFRAFKRQIVDSKNAFVLPPKNAAKQNLAGQTVWKYERPEAKLRLKKYLNRSFGVFALIGAGAGATVGQISDSPEEWENNAKGFARRFASGYAENAIQESVIYGLDETFRVDSQFYKKGKGSNFKTRLANALLSGVTSRTASGKRIPSFSRFIGTYAGSIIAAEAWFPKRYSYQDGLREGSYSLGFNIGLNLVREFIFK